MAYHTTMTVGADGLLNELGLEQNDLMLDPLDQKAPTVAISPSPMARPQTPFSELSLPYAPPSMSSSSSIASSDSLQSAQFFSSWPIPNQPNLLPSSNHAQSSWSPYQSNPYFGFTQPLPQQPVSYQPRSQSYPSAAPMQPEYPASLIPDLLGTFGGSFKGPDTALSLGIKGPDTALSFGSIDPSMLQTEMPVPSMSAFGFLPPVMAASQPIEIESPFTASPEGSTTDSPPLHPYDLRHPPRQGPRAHRWSYSAGLHIDTTGFDGAQYAEPMTADMSGYSSRPFSAGASLENRASSPRLGKARKNSMSTRADAAPAPPARLGFDAAQREKEFETLYEETGGNPSKKDRRRLQNRLAQRAFRARSKVSAVAVRRASFSHRPSPTSVSVHSRSSQ